MSFRKVHLLTLISDYLLLHLGFCKRILLSHDSIYIQKHLHKIRISNYDEGVLAETQMLSLKKNYLHAIFTCLLRFFGNDVRKIFEETRHRFISPILIQFQFHVSKCFRASCFR